MGEVEKRAPSRARKLLRRVLLGLAVLVVVLGGLVVAGVYKHIDRRAGLALPKAQAPDFALADANGAPISLASLTARGPAVLVFYRGFW